MAGLRAATAVKAGTAEENNKKNKKKNKSEEQQTSSSAASTSVSLRNASSTKMSKEDSIAYNKANKQAIPSSVYNYKTAEKANSNPVATKATTNAYTKARTANALDYLDQMTGRSSDPVRATMNAKAINTSRLQNESASASKDLNSARELRLEAAKNEDPIAFDAATQMVRDARKARNAAELAVNKDLIDNYGVPEGTIGDAIFREAEKGYYGMKKNVAGFQNMIGADNDAELAALDDILSSDKYNYAFTNNILNRIGGASQLVGQQIYQGPSEVLGALAAGGVASVAGKLGPQALVPEEVLTVPYAAAAGAKIQGAILNFEAETYSSYEEQIEKGVDPETAFAIAVGVGAINAGLEAAQLSSIIKLYGNFSGKALTKAGLNKVLKALENYGIFIVDNTAQELLQETSTILGTQAGSLIQNGEKAYSLGEIGERLGETAISSAISFALTGLPRGARNTAYAARQQSNIEANGAVIKAYGDDQVFIERGLEADPATKAYQYAAQAQEKISNGEALTDAEAYNLAQAVTNEADRNFDYDYNDYTTAEEDLVNLASEKTAPSVTAKTTMSNVFTAPINTAVTGEKQAQTNVQSSISQEEVSDLASDFGSKGRVAFEKIATSVINKETLGEVYRDYARAYEIGKNLTEDEAQILVGSDTDAIDAMIPKMYNLSKADTFKAVVAGYNDAYDIGGTDEVRSRGQEWNDSLGSGGQNGSVSSFTGRFTGKQSQKAAAIQGDGRVRAQGLRSAQSEGITLGSENQTFRIIPDSVISEIDELRSLKNKKAKEGVSVTFISGNMEVYTDSSKTTTKNVRAAVSKDGKKMWIRADHDNVSAAQLAKHEDFHRKIFKNRQIFEAAKDKFLKRFGQDEMIAAVKRYCDAYSWDITNVKSLKELSDFYDFVLEEILADNYAGIDVFYGVEKGATAYGTIAEEAVKEAAPAKAEKRGPPAVKFSQEITNKITSIVEEYKKEGAFSGKFGEKEEQLTFDALFDLAKAEKEGQQIEIDLSGISRASGASVSKSSVGSALEGKKSKSTQQEDYKVLGSAISTKLVKDGYIDFIGQTVKSAEDLAVIMQAARDPRFETGRILYVKNNKIVFAEQTTCRLPGVTFLQNPNDGHEGLKHKLDVTGADGYYLVHNHPSGNVTASAADIFATKETAKSVPGFLGHIIIDHNKYTTVSASGHSMQHDLPLKSVTSEDVFRTASMDHPLLGLKADNPATLTGYIRSIADVDGTSVALMMTSNLKVNAVLQLSDNVLGQKGIEDKLRSWMSDFGSRHVVLGTSSPDVYNNKITKDLYRRNMYLDIIYKDEDGVFSAASFDDNFKKSKRTYESGLNNDEQIDSAKTINSNNAGVTSFKFSQDLDEINAKSNLIAVHNTTEAKLLNTLKLEGLPGLSTAVINIDNGLANEKFGAISLVFDKSTIDPKRSGNAVYGADAWTPTANDAQIERRTDIKKIRAFDKQIAQLANKVLSGTFYDSSVAESRLYNGYDSTSETVDSFAERLMNNDAVKAAYIASKGEDLKPKMKPQRYSSSFENEQLDYFLELFKDNSNFNGFSNEVLDLYEHAYNRSMTEDEISKMQGIFKDMLIMKGMKEKWAENLSKSRYSEQNFIYKFLSDVLKYDEQGRPKAEEIDKAAVKEDLDAYIEKDRSSYESWVTEQVEKSGMFTGEEGIYNNDYRITESGRKTFKQSHLPVTAANIVKAMKKNGERGVGYAGSGAEGIQALAATKYNSISDIKADKGRLKTLSEEDQKNRMSGYDEKIAKLLTKIAEITKSSTYAVTDPFMEAAAGSRTANAIKKAYKDYGLTINDYVVEKSQKLYDEIASLPVSYFEAKSTRVVGFNEIRQAVIPDNSSDKLITALDKNSIPYTEYKAGDNAQRLEIIRSFDDLKFSQDLDNKYMDLAKDPVKNEAQLKDMVDQAAKAAGYNVKMYHGTTAGRFNIFRTNEIDNNMGSHFGSKELAQGVVDGEYLQHDGGDPYLFEVYLKAQNPYDTYDWFAQDDLYPVAEARDLAKEIGTPEAYAVLNEIRKIHPRVAEIIDEPNSNFEEGYFSEFIRNDKEIYPSGIIDQWNNTLYGGLRKLLDLGGYDSIRYENGLEVVGDIDYIIQHPEQIKDAAPVTYDDNGNVIPLSKRFDPTQQDIRFSQDLEIVAQNEQLKKDLEAAAKRADYWKGQTQLTKRQTVKETSVNKYTKDLLKSSQSTLDYKEVAPEIKSLAEYILNGSAEGKAKKDMRVEMAKGNADSFYYEVKTWATDIAREIIQNAAELANGDQLDEYQQIKNYFKGKTINAEIAKDMAEYNSIRKHNFGRFILSTAKGEGLDEVYENAASQFGEEWFPRDLNKGDKLIRISEVLDSLNEVYQNPYSSDMDGAIEFTANGILNDLLNGELAETPPTFADKKKAQIDELKAKNRAAAAERVKAERAARNKAIVELKAHYAELNKNKLSRKAESEAKTKLLKIARRLNNKKLPAVNRLLLQQYIGDLDLVSKSMTKKSLNRLTDLQAWYQNKKDTDPEFIADPHIEEVLKRLSNRKIADMTMDEVLDLTKVLLNIENEIATKNKLIDSQFRYDIYVAGSRTITDIEDSAGVSLRTAGSKLGDILLSETLSPERAIRRLTGYIDDDPMYIATKELSEGQRKEQDYTRRAYKLFDQWTEDRKFTKTLAGKDADKILITGTTAQGKELTVPITKAMRMALYLHSKNDQNLAHIKNGGLTIPDWKMYVKGELKAAYDKGVTIRLKPSDVRSIVSQMSVQEKAFAEAASRYFNGMSRDELNETNEKLKGYSIASVDNYYPINTDKNFLKADPAALNFDGSIQNPGWLEERKNATNPIYLRDMTSTLDKSVKEHAKYVGLAIPVRNFNKIYGVTTLSFNEDGSRNSYESSVQQALGQKWGPNAKEYIEKLLKDLSTTGRVGDNIDSALAKVRSNYAGAVLTLNYSVALKQAASYPNAAAITGWGPLLKAMKIGSNIDMNQLEKYTPLFWYRSKGFSTQELGDLKSRNKSLPKALNWIQAIDLLTTKKLAKAAELKALSDNPDLVKGSESYWKAVADVYNKVIEDTQPNYTIMQRPQILRSESSLLQNLNMFKTQPYQNFNIVYDAVANMQAKKKAATNLGTDEARSAYKAARKSASNAVTSMIASFAVFAGMTMAANLARGKKDRYEDEDGEMTALSVIFALLKDMLGGALGTVPFGTEVNDIANSMAFGDTYYGIDAISASALEDFANSLIDAEELFSDITEKLANGEDLDLNDMRIKLDKIADNTSKFFGIPYENVMKLVEVGVLWSTKAVGGKYYGEYVALKITANPANSYGKARYYDLLYKAKENDPAAYNKIRSEMIDSGYFKAENIDKAMKKRASK